MLSDVHEFLHQDPQHGRVMDVEVPGDRAGAITGIEPAASLLPLVLVERWLPPELDALGSCNLPSGVGTGDDAVALVLGHRTEEGDEAAAEGRSEIQVGLIVPSSSIAFSS